MAKKGKAKISRVKRNNQTTNKMKKQGKLKLQRHRTKVQKQRPSSQPQIEYSDSEGDGSGNEWADMLDDGEQQYIMNRLIKQPRLLSNIPEEEKQTGKKRKRIQKEKPEKQPRGKHSDSGAESESGSDRNSDSDSDVEDKYEKELAERPAKKMRPLLPIKTKEGLFEREEECEDSASEVDDKQTEKEIQEQGSDSDSGVEGTAEEDAAAEDSVVTTVQLLADRRDKLRHEKLRIGALCSSLLEDPEKKLKNLYPILYLMEERLKDGALNLHSVRKIATLSAYEVFKDILPDYRIRHQDYTNVKLKKDTLSLYKHEKELVEFYKRYLQRLEKATSVLRQKKGDTRRECEASVGLAVVSLRCMCGLLAARPATNYAANVAQSVVPLLDSRRPDVRALVTDCCVTVFAEDRKGEISSTIVRLINQLVKRRGQRLQPGALSCLLSLRVGDLDLDRLSDIKHKKQQNEKHKKRIVNLSKKEKKRAKKLKEVERELLETEAHESEATRNKHLTEVTKMVFHIYFRLLKSAPGSKLLSAALDGIAKFTHVINLEYYSELVSLLGRVVSADGVDARARLACVRSALAVLRAGGDALNVDPHTFHRHLYQNALYAHLGGTSEAARAVLEAAGAVAGRARRVSPAVLQALAKRLATLALQLAPAAALAALHLLHHLVQVSKPVQSLLEGGEAVGSGRFDPLCASPEASNAGSARLAELAMLRRHAHPTVRAAAAALLHSAPLPPELHKLTTMQVLQQYDGSQMSFKPAVPPPRRPPAPATTKPPSSPSWASTHFKDMCQQIEQSVDVAALLNKR